MAFAVICHTSLSFVCRVSTGAQIKLDLLPGLSNGEGDGRHNAKYCRISPEKPNKKVLRICHFCFVQLRDSLYRVLIEHAIGQALVHLIFDRGRYVSSTPERSPRLNILLDGYS